VWPEPVEPASVLDAAWVEPEEPAPVLDAALADDPAPMPPEDVAPVLWAPVEPSPAVPEVPEPDMPEPPPAVARPDPDDLARAVDAFLAGTPGAGVDLQSLAGALRDQLALDPVADAVERLVHEAGQPPDPTLLNMADWIMNPAVGSRIVQRIGHERDETRKAEYTVLCQRLGEVMAKAFRGALTGATEPEARRAYYDMLIAMGDTSRPVIDAMVEDENTLLVRSGVAILGDIGGDGALRLVTSGLAHPDARVRREALLALAKLGDEETGALVVGFLDDPERDVRVAAAEAAGALEVDRALRPLLKLLEAEGDGEDAVPFIDALGALGDPGAVPAIEKHAVKSLFSKPRTEVRIAAYRALHAIGTPHARELVQKALSDKEPAVRAAVRRIAGSSTAG
jgi:hypothetical protein